jgi:CheY-like chemotaxis protein
MSKKTILYVDDENDIRLVVRASLEDAGYRVLTAANAEEGLKVAFTEFPDLIITDVMMPGESGYSLCKKLKEDPSTAKIPVVFLTVMDNENTAMEAGGTAFLSKPFDEQQLRSTVSTLLNASDGRVELDLAAQAIRAGDFPRALASLERVIVSEKGSPLEAWARYYAAQVHHHQGNAAKATDEYKLSLAADPTFFRSHVRLAQLAEAGGDVDRALKHYERSLSINPQQADISQHVARLKGR